MGVCCWWWWSAVAVVVWMVVVLPMWSCDRCFGWSLLLLGEWLLSDDRWRCCCVCLVVLPVVGCLEAILEFVAVVVASL